MRTLGRVRGSSCERRHYHKQLLRWFLCHIFRFAHLEYIMTVPREIAQEMGGKGAAVLKEVKFDASQLDDLQSVAEQLFGDPATPGSLGYRRVLVRPRIQWWKIGLQCLLPVLATLLLGPLLVRRGMDGMAACALCLTALALYVLLRGRRALICLIQIYQRYAPASIRNRCRFEPSCSQYMILALEKYGLCKGLKKGIGRLKRCNINYGGFDLP